jgi:sulfoxide reductase heme-binding subunit YedZ
VVLIERLRQNWFRYVVHGGALAPLVFLLKDVLLDRFLIDLVAEATARTGQTALILLLLSLACTPLYILLGLRQALQVRRTLGLYALLYAGLHLLVFVWLDYGLDWPLIWDGIVEQRFVMVGLLALLILTVLGITSTKGWRRRLGKGWKRLHRSVYLAGILAVLHFIWSVKDFREPLVYAGVLTFLLGLRIPPVKRAVISSRRGLASAWSTWRAMPERAGAPSDRRADLV